MLYVKPQNGAACKSVSIAIDIEKDRTSFA